MTRGTPVHPAASAGSVLLRGSNQTGIRAHNERLVLSLVRQVGPLSKAEIARRTGLSAQAVSVIMRALEAEGLLARGEAVRGRVGQPSVPMGLVPEGAYFFGLKVGRRSLDLVLVDFLGRALGHRRRSHRYPAPDATVAFAVEGIAELTATLPAAAQGRIAGLGIAIPFFLWNWAEALGVPPTTMAPWRDRNIEAELRDALPFPVLLENDASSACNAELVFGTQDKPSDFLYVYIGYFAGGGLVLNGSLYRGSHGNAAAIGPLPIPGPGAQRNLMEIASLSVLEAMLLAQGHQADGLWKEPERWRAAPDVVAEWAASAGPAIAHVGIAASALADIDTLVLDGSLPITVRAQLVEQTEAALARSDLSGLAPPKVQPGSVGTGARALGAAGLPLAYRFLVGGNAFAGQG